MIRAFKFGGGSKVLKVLHGLLVRGYLHTSTRSFCGIPRNVHKQNSPLLQNLSSALLCVAIAIEQAHRITSGSAFWTDAPMGGCCFTIQTVCTNCNGMVPGLCLWAPVEKRVLHGKWDAANPFLLLHQSLRSALTQLSLTPANSPQLSITLNTSTPLKLPVSLHSISHSSFQILVIRSAQNGIIYPLGEGLLCGGRAGVTSEDFSGDLPEQATHLLHDSLGS